MIQEGDYTNANNYKDDRNQHRRLTIIQKCNQSKYAHTFPNYIEYISKHQQEITTKT